MVSVVVSPFKCAVLSPDTPSGHRNGTIARMGSSILRRLRAEHPQLAHISTLLTGTVIAQLIVLVTTPIIGRLYTPEDIGSFAAFLAVPQIVAGVSAGRYDMAIVLPARDDEARRLVRVSLTLTSIVSALTSVLCWIFAHPISRALNHEELAGILGWSGIVVMCLSVTSVMNYWLTRLERFSAISSNRVLNSAGIELSRIGAPFAGLAPLTGQIFSQFFGQILSTSALLYRGRSSLVTPETGGRTTKQLLHRYRRMPLLNAPNVLVDAVRINGIVLLIGVWYSADPQGQFAKAWLLMQAPVALITSAVSQVTYRSLAVAPRGTLLATVLRSIRLSFFASIGPFVLLALIAPSLFPWYLGFGWEQSGLIAQALIPWLLLNVVTSPISTVFVVTDRQGLMLAFACVYAAIPLGIIHIMGGAGFSIVTTLWVVSIVQALLLAGLTALTVRVARVWDKSDNTESLPVTPRTSGMAPMTVEQADTE